MPGSRGHRRHRATLSLSLVVSVCVAATACSRFVPEPGPDGGRSLSAESPVIVNYRTPRADLLPANVSDPYGARILSLVLRGLVRYDAKGKAVNEVADGIDNEDDRIFTVRLKQGWTFTNGEPVTARSFIDTWNWAVLPANRQRHADAFSPIAGYAAVRASTATSTSTSASGSPSASASASGRAARNASAMTGLSLVDAYTFRVTLSAPMPTFASRLGSTAFLPLPSTALKDPAGYARRPVGNGPYLLTTDATTGKDVRLQVNDDYPGEDKPRNKGLVFRPYVSLDKAYADLKTGRLDVLDTLPVSALPTARDDLKLRAVNQPVGMTSSLVFPMESPTWRGRQGRLLRHAISRSIDRPALADELYRGTRAPAVDYATPVVSGHTDICGDSCVHDVPEARSFLRRAGGFPDTLHIAYAADTDDATLARRLCAGVTTSLRITCSPRRYDTQSKLTAAVESGDTDAPFISTSRMRLPTLAGFLVPRFVSGSAANDSGYAGKTVQTLLKRADALPDGEESLGVYQNVERALVSDLPVIPLWQVNATGGSAEVVQDVRFDVFGVPVYSEISRP